jgi:type I site-specific restriction endonuclease
MHKLNLPEFNYKLKKAEGKVWIFDGIRKKYIVLTPEEWVRQHFIHYLTHEKKYPKSLIRVEGGLIYNQLQKRTDIVVYNRLGKPWMIVECKSPAFPVSPATLTQASVYNTTLKAAYITVTNGLVHLCTRIDWLERKTTLLDDTPEYPECG